MAGELQTESGKDFLFMRNKGTRMVEFGAGRGLPKQQGLSSGWMLIPWGSGAIQPEASLLWGSIVPGIKQDLARTSSPMFKKTTSSTPPNIAILSSSTLIEKSPPHFLYHQQHNGQHSGCHQEIWDQVLALLLVCCATPGKSVNLSEFHPSQREESTPTWDYCGVKCGAIGESSW